MHIISYYVGGVIAVVSGTIGLGLYKRINLTGLGVSVLSVILGFVFVLDAPTGVLYALLQPHAIAMEMTGGLTALAGLAGIAASLIVKRIGALKS
jgi:hypothetical protein